MNDKIKSLEEKLKTAEGTVKIDLLNDLANAYYTIDPAKTEELAQHALTLAESINYTQGCAHAYRQKGISYFVRGDFVQALTFYYNALTYFEAENDFKGTAYCYNNIGVVYKSQNQYPQALEYYFKVLDIYEQIADQQGISLIYNNIGNIYQQQNQYPIALEYYLKSVAIKNKIGDQEGLSISYTNIGAIYENQEQYSLASEYYLKSLAIEKQTGDQRGLAVIYMGLSGVYTAAGRYAEAEDTLKKAIQSAQLINAKNEEMSAYKLFYQLYKTQQKFELALEYHEKVLHLSNEIFNDENTRAIARAEARRELELKEKEAELHRLKNAELKRSQDILQQLSIIGQKITATLDFEEVLTTFYEYLQSFVPADTIGIGLYHNGSHQIEYKFFMEQGQRVQPSFTTADNPSSLAAWCIQHKKEVIIQSFEDEYHHFIQTPFQFSGSQINTQSIIYLPLITGDKIQGVFTIQNKEKNAYTDDHLLIIRTLASYLGIALDNAVAYHQISTQREEIERQHDHLQDALNELHRSEEKVRIIFENARVGIAMTDMQGNIFLANETFVQLLGYTSQEMCQMNYKDFLLPDDKRGIDLFFKQISKGKHRHFNFDRQYICKDGRLIWGHFSGSVISNDQGKPESIIGIIADISQLKQSYENITILTQMGQNITENLRLGSIVSTLYENITQLMPADAFFIAIFNEDTQILEFEGARAGNKHFSGIRHPLDRDDLTGVWSFKNRQTLLMNDYVADYQRILQRDDPAKLDQMPGAALYVVFYLHNKPVGVIAVHSYQKDAYTENHVHLLQNLGTYLAIAIENSKAYGKIEEQKEEIESQNEELSEKNIIISQEQEKSERLLLNILPVAIAEELKLTGKATPTYYKSVTVLFTDFVNFTQIAEMLSPQVLVSELDDIFAMFDEIVEEHNLEKIKTIGDAYMCAGGLPIENETHPFDAVNAALRMLAFVEKRNQQSKIKWQLRVGIHTGSLVAGVVGQKKFAYDIWGDAVNVASRMESSGEAGKVNISGETYQYLVETLHVTSLQFEYRGKIHAKNKGEVEMYFVSRAL